MTDRTHQPAIRLPEALQIPELTCHTLDNGMQLYAIHAGTQRVLRLTVVVRAGTVRQCKPFVASTLLNMLSEGTERYSSAEIAEMLDTYGIYYDTSIDRDFGMVTISCLEKFLDQALHILQQVLLHPTFDERELDTYRTKRKEQLRQEREKPSYIARELFSETLFGNDHPYGVVSSEDQYDHLQSDDLRTFFDRFYKAENMFAVTSGWLEEASIAKIQDLLRQIPQGGDCAAAQHPIPMAAAPMGQTVYQPREGAMQSSIRIGKRLFPKNHPDFNGMQVVAMILGGYFSSRLVNNLREEKGYTYGVYAAMMNLEYDGYIAIATDVEADATPDACHQIFAEIERLRQEPVPAEELDMVRNIISGEIMRIVDGPFGIADITIEGVQIGCTDNRYLTEFIEEVKAITPERIQALAVQYMAPEDFTTIIVGRNEDSQGEQTAQ